MTDPNPSPPMRFTIGIAVLLTLPLFTAVQAQAPAAGAKVRVTEQSPSRQVHTGKLVSLDRDTLVMTETEHTRDLNARADRTVTTKLGTATIARLEVVNGRRSGAGRGALIGAGLGVVSGFVFGATFECDWCTGQQIEAEAAGMLIFGVLGTAVGALVGAATGTERWAVQPIPEPVAR